MDISQKKSPITICLIGTESTGKTTLGTQLARHYSCPIALEYGRLYAEGKVYLPDYSIWQTEEFEQIAENQIELIRSLEKKAKNLLIADTDAFATHIWHHRYMGFFSEKVHQIADRFIPDLYLLMAPDIGFVQDGTRDGEHIRQSMHETFLSELDKDHKKYEIITGHDEARFKNAVRSISSRLL